MSDTPEATSSQGQAAELSEQMRVRRDKRERLIAAGVSPYPIVVERSHSLAQILAEYDAETLGPDACTGVEVAAAGRVIFLRNTRKAVFREAA